MPQAQKRLRRAIRTGGLERSDIKVDKKKGEADHAPSPPQQAQNAAYKDEILKRFWSAATE